jgi:hypothetical protein
VADRHAIQEKGGDEIWICPRLQPLSLVSKLCSMAMLDLWDWYKLLHK